MIDMVGNPLQVGDYGAFTSGPGILYFGRIGALDYNYGFMAEYPTASIPSSFFYGEAGARRDHVLSNVSLEGRRLSKVTSVADLEIPSDLPWSYFEAMILPDVAERRGAETGYDFCFNTLKDGDFVTFGGHPNGQIGRIETYYEQQFIEVLEFAENELIVSSRIAILHPYRLAKLPAISGYRCSDSEHHHRDCFKELKKPLVFPA